MEKHEPLFRLLEADEIEVKVKQASEKGVVALLYKTARTDMDILDETVGCEGWSNEYKEINENLFCSITINGVTKWDCGVESRKDDEGNEKKGEASDAFKRAGFRWGIGRELYSSPFIFLDLPRYEDKSGKWKVKGTPQLSVGSIGYDENRKISSLTIKDNKTNRVIWSYPRGSVKTDSYVDDEEEQAQPKPETVTNAESNLRKEIIKLVKDAGRDEQKAKMFCEEFIEGKYKVFVKFDEMNLGQLAACKIEVNNVLVGKKNAAPNA